MSRAEEKTKPAKDGQPHANLPELTQGLALANAEFLGLPLAITTGDPL